MGTKGLGGEWRMEDSHLYVCARAVPNVMAEGYLRERKLHGWYQIVSAVYLKLEIFHGSGPKIWRSDRRAVNLLVF